MGALHQGHAALIRAARKWAGPAGQLVVSIYVNPTQFAPSEDLARYPRPVRDDNALCLSLGVDVLFRPQDLYLADHSTWVDELTLSSDYCGRQRPGHFRGVCTVVLKLFHLVRPDMAFFGRKDFQQLKVIERMVRDLDLAVKVKECPTIREADGLALSSRNRYLTEDERQQATSIFRALTLARDLAQAGGVSAGKVMRMAQKTIEKHGKPTLIEYVQVVEEDSLRPFDDRETLSSPCTMLVAAWWGHTRLIDNLRLL